MVCKHVVYIPLLCEATELTATPPFSPADDLRCPSLLVLPWLQHKWLTAHLQNRKRRSTLADERNGLEINCSTTKRVKKNWKLAFFLTRNEMWFTLTSITQRSEQMYHIRRAVKFRKWGIAAGLRVNLDNSVKKTKQVVLKKTTTLSHRLLTYQACSFTL